MTKNQNKYFTGLAVWAVRKVRLYRLGFPAACTTLRFWRGEGTLENWEFLRRALASTLKLDPDRHALYLNRADRKLKLPTLDSPHFVGKGHGVWNLRAYRTGVLDGQPVFEKVYLATSDAWRKLIWVYEDVLPELPIPFETPLLLRHVRGEWLAVAYFSLVPEVKPIGQDQLMAAAGIFRRTCKGFRLTKAEPVLTDFRRESMYSDGRNQLGSVLDANGRAQNHLDMLENWLLRPDTLRCFTHGDFQPNNILACGSILDLDRCGYYPIGYEYGVILGKFYAFDNIDALEVFIKSSIEELCKEMHIGILFFSVVFYSRRKKVKVSDEFILSLWDRLIETIDVKTLQANACRNDVDLAKRSVGS